MSVIRISFNVTAHFDCLLDVSEETISKIKELLKKETSEISNSSEPELTQILINSCTSDTFDFVLPDEDIEIIESDRMTNIPFSMESKPL